MSKYIDVEELVKEIERCSYETWSKGVNPTWWAQAVKVKDNILGCIERQPTADVVEVVRCKDCKYLYCLSAVDRQFYCRHFPKGLTGINIVEDNPYCSYGERKAE